MNLPDESRTQTIIEKYLSITAIDILEGNFTEDNLEHLAHELYALKMDEADHEEFSTWTRNLELKANNLSRISDLFSHVAFIVTKIRINRELDPYGLAIDG